MHANTWRAATWNLDHRRRNPRLTSRWDLIRRAHAEVVALQELEGREIRRFREEHLGGCLFSQEIYKPANLRWMGCGLLLPPATEIIDAGVFPELPKPQPFKSGLLSGVGNDAEYLAEHMSLLRGR